MTELYIQSIKCEGDGRKNWTEPVLNKSYFWDGLSFFGLFIACLPAYLPLSVMQNSKANAGVMTALALASWNQKL